MTVTPATIRGVVFDLDGTLIDSFLDICNNLNKLRAQMKLPQYAPEEIRPWIGRGATDLVQYAFADVLSQGVTVRQIVTDFRQIYMEAPAAGGAPYEGVPDGLRRLLGHGLKLAVATNKPRFLAQRVLKHYLAEFPFEGKIVGPEDVPSPKPHPGHLLAALAKIGVAPAEAVFVGDDPIDWECAQAAGVRFIGVDYGIGRLPQGPAARIDAFPQLIPTLERIGIFAR